MFRHLKKSALLDLSLELLRKIRKLSQSYNFDISIEKVIFKTKEKDEWMPKEDFKIGY